MKFYGNDIASLGNRRLRPTFVDDPMFGSFLEALPDGAALLEIDGTIKLVNSRFEMLLNLGKGDLVGTDIARHAMTAGPVIQKIATALQQLKRLEVSGTLTSQRLVVANLSILRTVDGGAYAGLLVLREPSRLTRSASAGPDRFRFQDESTPQPGPLHVHTAALQLLMKRGAQALDRGSPILVTGESGTGKSEFVTRLCRTGERGALPFVHVNCGTLSDEQFDVEMFGIEPGSAADQSTRGKLGYVEAADSGILFLDQITDLSPRSQTKLGAFLETRTYSRVGSAQRRQVRLQLVTATNRPIQALVADGSFRDDLYYRIAAVALHLAPIREQPELVGLLVNALLQRINMVRKPALALSDGFRQRLVANDLPGNIRELSNMLEQAAAIADDIARPEHFIAPPQLRVLSPRMDDQRSGAIASQDERQSGFKDLVQEFENWVLDKSIAQNGSKRSAAKALGIDIATLIRKTNRKR